MNQIIVSLGLLQVVFPIALILANTFVPSASRTGLVLRTCAVLLLIAYAALAGLWLFPPWWTPYFLTLLLIVGAVFRYHSTRSGQGAIRSRAEQIVAIFVLVVAVVFLQPVFLGRTLPEGAVDLDMPLGPGRYLVASGGTTEVINGHLATLNLDRTRAFRGQSYAVDIIGIDRFGLRATGIAPVDPTAYVIYGTPVLAPCNGTVAQVIDGIADMPVPQMDRANITGNSVMLNCAGAFVLLAHLAPNSIPVQEGQHITTGTQIGSVGNSGNTSEPHLHIHVQSALGSPDPISADPVWFTIDGQFLVRNDTFQVVGAP